MNITMDDRRSLWMEIDIETLAACERAADGGAIPRVFVDSAGQPATVTLSLNDAGSLAMTLPGLITKALQTRFGDGSLSCAYPLASWAIEQSSGPAPAAKRIRQGAAGRARVQGAVAVNEIEPKPATAGCVAGHPDG